jgi:hypothetical protein
MKTNIQVLNLIAPMLYMNMHYLFLAVLCFIDAFHNECYGIVLLFFIQVVDIFASPAAPAKEIKGVVVLCFSRSSTDCPCINLSSLNQVRGV